MVKKWASILAHWKTVAMHSILASRSNPFITGLTTPFRAARLIASTPKLYRLSIAPIALSVLLFIVFIATILSGIWTMVHAAFLSAIASYSGLIFVILSIIAVIGSFMMIGNFLTFFIALIASPLNDLLAEKTEETLEVSEIPHWNTGRFIRIFWIDLRKTIVTIFAGLVFSIGMMIPVANFFFMLGLALLNTFTYITYPQSRREQGLIQSALWIKNNFFLSIGFGLTTLALFSIPLVNLIAIPISVVGGTLLYFESKK